MTKLQQMLTSLVAAIPAAYLVYALVSVMFSNSENLSTVSYIVIALTLLAALSTVLIPAAVMIGGNRKPAPETAPAKRKESSDDIETLDDDVEVNDESSVSIDAMESQDDLVEASDFELDDSSEDVFAGSDDSLSTDSVESFDIDDEEEEPKPKSKKKKR